MERIESDPKATLSLFLSYFRRSLFILLCFLTVSCQSPHGLPSGGEDASAIYTQRIFEQMASDQRDIGQHYCEQAVVEMATFYKHRNFSKSIEKAHQILENFCTSQSNFKAYEILGDVSYRLEKFGDSIRFYAEAAQLASSRQKEALMGQSLLAAVQLEPVQFIELSAEIKPDAWRKELLFTVGTEYIKKGNDADALLVLGTFCIDFSDDRRVVAAEKAIDRILDKTTFNRNRIGVLLPLTGAYQHIGQRILKAVEMAVDPADREGSGQSVSLIVKDTGADPERSVAAVKSLGNEGVAGIIGPLVTAREAALEANRLGIPMIVLTQKEDIPQIGKFIFRNFITPEMQAEALVSYLTDAIGIYRFAVMYPDESYGVSFKDAFLRTIETFDGEVNAVESYNQGQTDFALPITNFIRGYQKIEKNGDSTFLNVEDPRERHGNYNAIVDFDALFIPDSAEIVAMIAPQLRFYDINDIILVGTNLWSSGRLVEMAGPYVQGAIYPSDFDIAAANHKMENFISAYADVGDEPPGFIEAIGFDTASIMIRALSLPETTSRSDLVNSLLSIQDFEGLTGMSGFKPSREPEIHLKLCQIVRDRSLVIPD